MQAYYFDTSALVKRYIAEPGSAWVRSLLEPPARYDAYSITLARVEAAAAIVRRLRAGSITTRSARALGALVDRHLTIDFNLVAVRDEVIAESIVLALRHGLRPYDSVHLAAALRVQTMLITNGASPLIFVSSDLELNAAAGLEGLVVEDPNTHI